MAAKRKATAKKESREENFGGKEEKEEQIAPEAFRR